MPRLLPDSLHKVIYLDADLIIRADLGELWDTRFDGAPCLAVQDCHIPFLNAEQALANFDKCGRHLASAVPVSNYRELGLNPLAPYFNAGVLVVDIEAWRHANLTRKMLDCLDRNRDHVRWHDQYAMNVVLSEQWRPLDPRWNQGANVYHFKKWSRSPYDRETFTRLRDDPYIIHFTTKYKPWKISCLHPRRDEFYDYVDRTEWAGWRPARFSSPATVLEFLKTQERRLRIARRHLQLEIAERLHSMGLQGANRIP
jgi:lipopolysaccharide biosynthesis glycosyltransferase